MCIIMSNISNTRNIRSNSNIRVGRNNSGNSNIGLGHRGPVSPPDQPDWAEDISSLPDGLRV